jgi:hypothetical protein
VEPRFEPRLWDWTESSGPAAFGWRGVAAT